MEKAEEQFSQPIVQFMQDIGNFRDCTLPGDIKWENIRTAIDAAHSYKV